MSLRSIPINVHSAVDILLFLGGVFSHQERQKTFFDDKFEHFFARSYECDCGTNDIQIKHFLQEVEAALLSAARAIAIQRNIWDSIIKLNANILDLEIQHVDKILRYSILSNQNLFNKIIGLFFGGMTGGGVVEMFSGSRAAYWLAIAIGSLFGLFVFDWAINKYHKWSNIKKLTEHRKKIYDIWSAESKLKNIKIIKKFALNYLLIQDWHFPEKSVSELKSALGANDMPSINYIHSPNSTSIVDNDELEGILDQVVSRHMFID